MADSAAITSRANLQDLSGRRFGRLVVQALVGRLRKKALWECVCDCGNIVNVISVQLKSGETKSCGCLRRELTGKRFRAPWSDERKAAFAKNRAGIPKKEKPKKRTRTFTPEQKRILYYARKDIIRRCENKNFKDYKHYGARGISVCSRWKNGEDGRTGIQCFRSDMGARPGKGFSIDRIDNDLGYFPENCRWATKEVQVNNRRNSFIITAGGVSISLAQWSRKTGVSTYRIRARLRSGMSPEEAVNWPR
ncbi:MAG TPA: hypothetical protein VKA94_15155 [Hyphomicrobiales bacterium]|nr:hypothetical protein [Hyphomicrobiales bacterium]